MTQDEKTALLGYLEFNLTKMVEQYQIELNVTHHSDDVDEIIGPLWDGAHELLAEMECSITERIEDNVLTIYTFNGSPTELKNRIKKFKS